MKPRWLIALAILTLPIWFVPVCAWAGYRAHGRDTLRDVPGAIRYVLRGRL